MKCLVYRSTRHPEMYLFLDQALETAELPEGLRERVGDLTFALEFELTPERSLARADAATVLASLESQGFYLQLPPRPFNG